MSILNLTEENFEENTKNNKVFIYFYDNKKKASRIFDIIMQGTERDINKDTKICKININDAPKLKIKYGIMSLPTSIYLKNGKLDRQIVGIRTQNDILEIFK